MTITLVLNAILGGDSILPLEAGKEVTFDDRTFKVERLEKEIELIDGDGTDVVFLKTKDRHFLALTRDGEIEFVVATAGNNFKIYKREHTWFLLAIEIPKSLKPGMKWKSSEVFLSCGFGAWERELEAVADGENLKIGNLVLKRGHGIVSWK